MVASQIVFSLQRSDDVPEHDDWLSPRERDVLATLRFPKRRHDWRMGRWTAKQCIANIPNRSPSEPVEIVAASDGAPEVYDVASRLKLPLHVSISHSGKMAIAVVASTSVVALGCDVEAVVSRSQAFVRDYFTENERKQMDRSADNFDLAVNALWSAKESALKALRVGLRRDTRTIDVRLDVNSVCSKWRLLSVHCAEDANTVEQQRVFSGWWRTFGDMVVTVVCDPLSAPQLTTGVSSVSK